MDQAPSISGAASHTARPPVHFFFFLLGLLPGPRVNRQDKPDPVAWSMPDGFTLGAEPSKLDASLVGKHIYMRWKDYGWQLGKVYEQITSANPRLLKKYNYRVVCGLGRHRKGPDQPSCRELRARLGRGSRLVGGAGAQGGRRRRSGVGGGRQRACAEGSKLADEWG